ncbi:MAG: UDP-N-acetylmuramoylalanine-D-glutamate ligase, partial [Candidatus Kaiserbacteria bacterium GW2011_GWC2_52_8b]
TTPEATVAALRALNVGLTKSHIVLITGGSDKGLDTSELVHAIRAYAKKVVFLGGTGTDTIKNNFPDAPIVDSLAKALEAAMAISSPGDTILFSPAFASFGMFKNEYDRNDQFITLVTSL